MATHAAKAKARGVRSRVAVSRTRGRLERQLIAEGFRVAGVDEVGRGCLAGPVFAGCAVLDFQRVRRLKTSMKSLLRDSKKLSSPQRAKMVPVITELAISTGVASSSVEEIERLGIVQATFLAMRRALANSQDLFDVLLVDGKLKVAGWQGEQRTIVKGDDLCFSIAAASILAKEARDSYMRKQADEFPEYGFDVHVGYGTRRHLAMIEQHGICRLHRRNFEPIRPFAKSYSPTQPDLLV